MTGWQFWVDRRGTFTDVVARRPEGGPLTRRPLSKNRVRYADAAVAGVWEFREEGADRSTSRGCSARTATSHSTKRPSATAARAELRTEDVPEGRIRITRRARLRYDATDTALTVEIAGSDATDVGPGDVLVIETPGGGYGPPPLDPHQAGEEFDDLRAF
ncbi:hypothetical protein [Streptomyces sp. NPDC050535]|uniref:hypothetical protein n=1 Tax=Streptomyces sp. NPDC050535 TaxID=3365626 RepID=UPI0037A902D9